MLDNIILDIMKKELKGKEVETFELINFSIYDIEIGNEYEVIKHVMTLKERKKMFWS